MKLYFIGFLLTSGIVLTGCAQPDKRRADVQQDFAQMGCAISFSAVQKMRNDGILADPDMLKGCNPKVSQLSVDIEPSRPVTIPTTGVSAKLYQSLRNRQMPESIARNISASPAFADWVKIAERLKLLQQ